MHMHYRFIAVRDNPLRAAPSSLPPCDGDLATPPPLPPPMPPLSELDHSKDAMAIKKVQEWR